MLYSTVATAAHSKDKIIWEITNRFSPFELTSDPTKTFKSYKLKDDENWVQWHERQWDEQGSKFNSPYAHALLHNQKTHWDETKQEHDASLLKFIREEQSPETTVNISIHYPSNDQCVWKIGNQQPTRPVPCDKPQYFDIPLKGTKVAVKINGKELTTDSDPLYLKPTHLVIVGFGDSYGSGEGNPDVPAVWKKRFKPKRETTSWLTNLKNLEKNGRARWLDERCHRSFFSQQSLTALGIASKAKTTFVSFLHYACTGAEMFDGLLTPQFAPEHSEAYSKYSQLNAAIRELCTLQTLGFRPVDIEELSADDDEKLLRINDTELRPYDELDRKLRKQRRATNQMSPRSGVANCPEAFMPKKPDMVLLSVGGNDIGFSNMVHFFVVPVRHKLEYLGARLTFPDICPAVEYQEHAYKGTDHIENHCKRRLKEMGYDAGSLIGKWRVIPNEKDCKEPTRKVFDPTHIKRKYAVTFKAIQRYLHVSSDQIYLTQYPDPLRTNVLPHQETASSDSTAESACKTQDEIKTEPVYGDRGGYNVDSQWNALKTQIPFNLGKEWEFNLLEIEAEALLAQFDDLRNAIKKLDNVNVIPEIRDAFLGHGWWMGSNKGLPSHAPEWAPSDWQAYKYEAAGRAIRTPNDSYLTQAGAINQMKGTAHPNLLGHTLVADIIMEHEKVRDLYEAP